MHNRILAVLAALAVVALSSPAWASLMVDGTVGAGEYATVLNDVSPENTQDFYNTGLDIASFRLGSDATYDYFAMTVFGPPFDVNGGPTSIDNQTELRAFFYDQTGATKAYRVQIITSDDGIEAFNLKSWNGTAWVNVTLGAGDYSVATGNALEFRIAQSKMPSLATNPYVSAQLFDTGDWQDDRIDGVVPEPATLGLMALGLGAMIFGRKNRK
ncbi:MAG: PEP-CTERM sorting domain-containing protein [Planctomycetes bacterium]|nr:PEP-CTERM sorting domain-containing protein [Planctomycetota bacterium]